MDNSKLALYLLFLLVGWYMVSQNVDKMNHATPPEKFYGQNAEAMYLVPILALIVIHFGLDWLKNSRPEISEHGIPIALVPFINPDTQDEISKINWLTYNGDSKYLYTINAARDFRQKHVGQRIISVVKMTNEVERKLKNAVEYPYIYGDNISHEEIANYILEEGKVIMWDIDYRRSINWYPALIDVGNIKILEFKGMPKGSIDELISSLVTGGYAGTAQDIIASRTQAQQGIVKK